MNKAFDDPEWIHSESFGKDEWDTLAAVCQKTFGDEELAFEMMYSLIDIETQAAGINDRKGILDSLEGAIRKTYYRNEDDAFTYYRDTLMRSKELGGQYREKFFEVLPSDEETALEAVEESAP